MVTTGAAPTVAVLKEEFKNHPEKAMQMGITGAAIGGLPFPLSRLALVGMQNQTAIQKMVQNQYFSNIEAAVCAQRSMNQMGDTNGNE